MTSAGDGSHAPLVNRLPAGDGLNVQPQCTSSDGHTAVVLAQLPHGTDEVRLGAPTPNEQEPLP
jgi:hypothetical protein